MWDCLVFFLSFEEESYVVFELCFSCRLRSRAMWCSFIKKLLSVLVSEFVRFPFIYVSSSCERRPPTCE